MSSLGTPLLARAFLLVLRCTEGLITLTTRSGRTDVFPPEAFPWRTELEAAAPRIRAELDELLRDREAIPNFQDLSEAQRVLTQDSGWKTFFFFIAGQPASANCERCPATVAALQRMPGMTNALFSILAAGKHIPEHRGIYKGLLRVHLALIVPRARDSVRIHVNRRPYFWEEGRTFVFDDTYPHEVWNETSEQRVILMVDLERPLPPGLRQLNRLVIDVLGRTSIARQPLERLNRKADVQLPRT